MTKTSMIALILCASVFASAQRKPDAHELIVGEWRVDIEATIEAYTESDRASDLKKAELDRRIKSLRDYVRKGNLAFRFNKYQVWITKGLDTRTASYKIMRKGGRVLIINSGIKNAKTHKEVRLQINLRPDNTIKIISSETKDLDLYVWKKLPKDQPKKRRG